MKEVTKSKTEEAIIGILTDYIIWRRVECGVHKMLTAFDPQSNECEFEPDALYKGQKNAFILMGIYDDDSLCSKLSRITWDIFNKNEKADEVAKSVYVDWLVAIREYYVEKKGSDLALV